MGWELYFKNKKNLEQIMSISKLVMNLPVQWWKNDIKHFFPTVACIVEHADTQINSERGVFNEFAA